MATQVLSDEELDDWKTSQDYLTCIVYDDLLEVRYFYEDITYFAQSHNISVHHLLSSIKIKLEHLNREYMEATIAWQQIQGETYGIPQTISLDPLGVWGASDRVHDYQPIVHDIPTDQTILTNWKTTNEDMTTEIILEIKQNSILRTQIQSFAREHTKPLGSVLSDIIHAFTLFPQSPHRTSNAWNYVKIMEMRHSNSKPKTVQQRYERNRKPDRKALLVRLQNL